MGNLYVLVTQAQALSAAMGWPAWAAFLVLVLGLFWSLYLLVVLWMRVRGRG